MNKSHPTPYRDLNEVLRDLAHSMQGILIDNFIGAYLQGSFAIGDFDEHSDVDFIVAIHDDLTDNQVAALDVMHERIYNLPSPWAQHLEGSYFPQDVLRSPARRGQNLWYLEHGSRSLERSDHCNTVVVRWAVHERGVTLAGPPPHTLLDPIDPDVLRRGIADDIIHWGHIILDDPSPFKNRFYQGFLVLNYSRMLHDLYQGSNGSKRAGADWAKATLDPVWHDLIDRAWDVRPDPSTTFCQPADPADFARTLEFIRYIMGECERFTEAHWSN